MDNNQQSTQGGTQQPSKVDLGINNPSTMPAESPAKGSDVSMTVPQTAGGNITTTEVGSK
jgi:hypothetical protein